MRSGRALRAGLAAAAVAVQLCPVCARAQAVPSAAAPARAAAAPAPALGLAAARPLRPWLSEIAGGLSRIEAVARAGDVAQARQLALRLYLDEYELLETRYGAGGDSGSAALSARIGAVEVRFHELLRASDAAAAVSLAGELRAEVLAIGALPEAQAAAATAPVAGTPAAPAPARPRRAGAIRSSELRAVLARLDTAEAAYRGGRGQAALALVERAYLDGIEPLESRLPPPRVHEIERLVHLGVRAGIGAGAPAGVVLADFARLRERLQAADGLLGPGAPAWLGAANAFFVLVREGLEAVLLIAALLAYVAAVGAGRKARRQIYAGVAAGVVATLTTWAVATTLIPLGGASRELVEGITGLVAVGVLLYVSNWLFQKTYIHDWKEYLRQHVGKAVTTGSALAMASLAFAAVYREGFETVLFFEALLLDAGPRAVLAGALPGALLIGALGVGIIRLGVKLPLKRMFAFTNAVLLYLAFTFVGKGLYNLQEAGIFAPHPLSFLPDDMVLRQLLGVYPIVETLAAQLLFAGLVAATYLYHRHRLARVRAAPAHALAPTRAIA